MSTHLNTQEIRQFAEQGFLTPRRVYSEIHAAKLRARFESLARLFDREKALRLQTDLHLVQRWAWDVVHDPRIVDPVSDVLGPNVLLWSLNWFIKEPRDGKFVSYHQDATYWGLEPHDVVTAWLALSDATEKTGPMKFVSGSHREAVREHDDTFGAQNLLSRGQVVHGYINPNNVVSSPLQAGEMSLHHVRLIHGSEPNRTDDRRIGMVLRYCATHVRQTKVRDTAVLVKGEDEYGHFDLLPAPEGDFGEVELNRQKDATRRMHRAIHSKDYK